MAATISDAKEDIVTREEFGAMTVKDRVAYLRDKLGSDPAWAIRGLLRVYAEQTAEEREIEDTVEHNGVGFSGIDGEILSSFARQYREKGRLSAKQMAIVYKKMPRYARQIERLSRPAKHEIAA